VVASGDNVLDAIAFSRGGSSSMAGGCGWPAELAGSGAKHRRLPKLSTITRLDLGRDHANLEVAITQRKEVIRCLMVQQGRSDMFAWEMAA
jgi:hypothetical protein